MDRTPNLRAKRRPILELADMPKRECSFCCALQEVMPSGMFRLHTCVTSWDRRFCRGSGLVAIARQS